jgi:hypothetical protein
LSRVLMCKLTSEQMAAAKLSIDIEAMWNSILAFACWRQRQVR